MAKIDPESQAMWDELRKATPITSPLIKGEDYACCKVLRAAIEGGNTRLWFLNFSIPILYCPHCGRKLT